MIVYFEPLKLHLPHLPAVILLSKQLSTNTEAGLIGTGVTLAVSQPA